MLGEYHAALGDLVFRFEGTLERFTGDGLMVFFNDPLPCEDAPARAVGMAVAMRGRVRDLAPSWTAPRSRPRLLDRHRPGLRDPRPDRVRGPLRLRGHRQRDQPGRPAVRARPRRGRSRHPAGPGRRRAAAAVTDPVGDLELRGFSRPVRAFDVRGSTPPRCRRERPVASPAGRPALTLADLDEEQRYARFDRLQAGMAEVWDAMRLNRDGESVVVLPSVTLDRVAERQRRADPGVRGALPVPAAAAAPAPAADGLRDVDADRARRSSSTTWPCCPASSRATPGPG